MMFFVLLGTKAQYIQFCPFEESRCDTGFCTDNLGTMQSSLLIFDVVLCSPFLCHAVMPKHNKPTQKILENKTFLLRNLSDILKLESVYRFYDSL